MNEAASASSPSGLRSSRGDLFGTAAPLWLPVITLWQPWASLIFCPERYKKDETRGFRYPAKYDGRIIAIHAAANWPAAKHITAELARLSYDAFGCGYKYTLPRGSILGTVRLAGCQPTDLVAGFKGTENLIAGDWSSGRFAWGLEDVTPYPAPIPAKGKRGWWRWPIGEAA